MSSDPKVQPRIFLVVVAQGTYDHWDQLTEIETAAKELVEALCQPGSKFEWHLQTFLHGGTAPELLQELHQWLEANVTERDRLILYWTGHATRTTNFYLLVRNSPRERIAAINAVTPEALGDELGNCRAEKKLFFIDTCYSGDGATEFAQKTTEMFKWRTDAPGQTPYIGVIPATHSLLKAREAVFCRALREVLTASDAKYRTWEDDDEWIRVGELRDALYYTVRERVTGWQAPPSVVTGYGERFVPNPRYRSNLRLDVETSRLLAARVQIPDPLRLAGRGAVAGEHELYFTGRTAVRQKLASWLTQPGPRLAALTGPPGAGKSAVLGRLLLSAEPNFQSEIAAAGLENEEEVPVPTNAISAAVHVRAKTAEQTVQALAEQMFAGTGEPPRDLDAVLQRLRDQPVKGAIVVDALDEAEAPYSIGTLLRRLVEEGNCRVLVGTRRSPDGRVIPADEDRHGRLRQIFGEVAELTDLEDEAQTDADIAAYVRRRLQQSQQPHPAEAIDSIAQKVAAQAKGNFLYARIVARTLQEAKTLQGELPVGPVAALAEDIRQRFSEQEELVHGLFRGLAWARGEGVSRACWPAIATALTDGERKFTAADVTWALENVGWHVLQAQEDGQAVFRLVHQEFTDFYRQEPVWKEAAHREIAERLSAGISGLGWMDADPYCQRYLAFHARRGGILWRFVMDPAYLVTAKVGPLISRLYAISDDTEARRMAEIYQRAAYSFAETQIPERMALLEMAARQNDPELAGAFRPLLKPRWQCLWAHWRPAIPSITVANWKGGLGPAAIYQEPGIYNDHHPLLIAGKGRELCGWWLDDMREVPQRPLLEGTITAIVVKADSSEAIVGTTRGELAVFSLPDFVRIEYRPDAHLGAVSEVICFQIGSEAYIGTVDKTGDLSLWQQERLKLVATREKAAPPDPSIILAEWRGAPALITSGDAVIDQNPYPLRIWSLPELSLLASFGKRRAYVGTMHFVNVKQPLLLGAGWTDLYAWDLATLEPLRIAPLGAEPPAQYFLPVSKNEDRADILITRAAQTSLITIHGSNKLYLEATPWVEADYGRWLGPVRLWRSEYAVSLHTEIRLWNCRDLLKAIRTAPASYDELAQLQKLYGSPSIAAAEGKLFVSRLSGLIECFTVRNGALQWRFVLKERPIKVCYLAIGTMNILAVATKGEISYVASKPGVLTGVAKMQISFMSPETGEALLPELDIVGELIDFQPIQMEGTACLVVLIRTNDKEHILRFLRLPELEEVVSTYAYSSIEAYTAFLLSNSYPRMQALAVAEAVTGQVMIAVGEGQVIFVWRGEDMKEVLKLQPWPEVSNMTSLVVIPHAHETRFVVGTRNGRIALLTCNLETSLLAERTHQGGDVTVALVSWEGKPAIASGSSHEKLRLWTLDLEPLDEINIGAYINQIVAISAETIAIATTRGIMVIQSSGNQ